MQSFTPLRLFQKEFSTLELLRFFTGKLSFKNCSNSLVSMSNQFFNFNTFFTSSSFFSNSSLEISLFLNTYF